MKIFFALSQIILLIVSTFHLYACIKAKDKLRSFTKCLLMPIMIFIVIFSDKMSLFLVLGLFFSFIGDIFLLWNIKEKYFLFGLFSFLVCHIFYIIAILSKLPLTPKLSFFLPFIVLGIVFIFIMNKIMHKTMKKLTTVCNLYTYIILFGLISSIFLILNNKGINSILVLVGYILFIVSDSTLAFATFKHDIKFSNFYIMLTYILAQLLINMGLLFI